MKNFNNRKSKKTKNINSGTKKKTMKKKTLKGKNKGGSRFFQGYKFAPDYSVSTIDIDSYSGHKYQLKCNVCQGNQFMMGQGLIDSGRVIDASLLMDKHTIMCVCANCTHIMWFRKSTFVNKKNQLYSRDYGYSYNPKGRDPHQERTHQNELSKYTYSGEKPSFWSKMRNFIRVNS